MFLPSCHPGKRLTAPLFDIVEAGLERCEAGCGSCSRSQLPRPEKGGARTRIAIREKPAVGEAGWSPSATSHLDHESWLCQQTEPGEEWRSAAHRAQRKTVPGLHSRGAGKNAQRRRFTSDRQQWLARGGRKSASRVPGTAGKGRAWPRLLSLRVPRAAFRVRASGARLSPVRHGRR